MRRRIRSGVILLFFFSLAGVGLRPADPPVEPDHFFRDFVGLSDEQIRDIRAGKAVVKVLDSPTPDEVFVFGSGYINSTPERYLKFAADIDELRKLPSYL